MMIKNSNTDLKGNFYKCFGVFMVFSFIFFLEIPISTKTSYGQSLSNEKLQPGSKKYEFPVPNARQLAWQNAELGALISYELHVFDGKRYNQKENRLPPIDDYQIFNPKKLDTDQWIKAVKDAGFKFAILTATHETGFALYQSEVNPYCMKALNFQDGEGDIQFLTFKINDFYYFRK